MLNNKREYSQVCGYIKKIKIILKYQYYRNIIKECTINFKFAKNIIFFFYFLGNIIAWVGWWIWIARVAKIGLIW